MSFNQTIIDAFIRHSLDLEKLKKGLAEKYARKLRQIDQQVMGMLVGAIGGTVKQKREFLAELKRLKAESYDLVQTEFIDELIELVNRQSGWLYGLLAGLLVPSLVDRVDDVKPTRVKNILVRGLSLPERIGNLRNSEVSKLYALARTAVSDDFNVTQAREAFQLLRKSRDNAISAIVNTAAAGVIDMRNNAMFLANRRLIKGIKLAVVFDNRTTPTCIRHANENKLYPVDKYPHPPFHFNCRTEPVPIVKSYADLTGAVRKRVPVNTRATMTGDAPMDSTYSAWLKRQDKSIQNEALGKTRAALFRSGKLTINKFISPAGRFYTVDQLFQKYDI
tara:strand:- start:22514 stop:23518 length:1005 start_codon:yes stop_codon:yes gene_type:complete